MWFASGAIMLFVKFPALSDTERLAGGEAISAQGLVLLPQDVARLHPAATNLRLLRRDGREVYVAEFADRLPLVIDAATGEELDAVDAAAAGRIAARFAGQPAQDVRRFEYDQWIVHQGFDAGRPYYRVRLQDAASTDVYVSARTGEIAQRTTRSQRAWNRGGAVLHWIYFTPVRRHWSVWDRLVWWLSLLAASSAVAGFGLGLFRFVQARRRLGAGFAQYRRWLRWHHVLGVCTGFVLVAWIFSGWLSMDHGRLFSRGGVDTAQSERFQGLNMTQTTGQLAQTPWQLQLGRGYTELQFRSVAGQAFVLLRGGGAPEAVLLAGEDKPRGTVPDAALARAVKATWSVAADGSLGGSPVVDFYRRAEDAPARVATFLLPGAAPRWVLVDRLSAEPLVLQDASRRRYAWLYFGLHTYRLPGTEAFESLRKAVLLIALAAGFALSLTGVVLAWRRLNV